jgi:hypothetical protein
MPGDIPPADDTGPDDAAMRAELRDRGHNPPARGRLGADWVALWESGEGILLGDGQGQALNDAAQGVTDTDFIGDHAQQVTPETRPKAPRAAGWRARLGLDDTRTGPGKRKSGKQTTGARKAAPKHARVPLDRIGEAAFDGLARITRGLDPALSRTFAVEAPLAGMMIEDGLAGTVVDRVLQPVARAQAKSRVLVALFGMPMGILALEQAQTLPDRQRLAREAIIVPMLREAAVMWVEYAGDAITRKAERDAARGPMYEEADALLRHLIYGEPLGVPDPGEPGPEWAAAPAPEDQAARAAQQQATPGGFGGFMAPAPAGQYGHPYPPAQLVPRA